MKKYFFVSMLLFSGIFPGILRAQETPPPTPEDPTKALEALAKSHNVPWPFAPVTYHYKDENGKWVFHETRYYKLPPEMQTKNWQCWVDYKDNDNCMAKN